VAKHRKITREPVIFSPCAGDGAIANVLLAETGATVRQFDIAPRASDIHPGDITSPAFWRDEYRGEAIVDNPPFSLAEVLLRHALEAGAEHICLLLRLSWLESTKDRQALPDPQRLIVLPRPKYIESPEAKAIREAAGKKWGGDSVTSAWMIWDDSPTEFIIRVTRDEKKAYGRALQAV
jgi:hypothetical protein